MAKQASASKPTIASFIASTLGEMRATAGTRSAPTGG